MHYQAYLDNQPLNVLASTVFPAPYNEQQSAEFVVIVGEGLHDLHLIAAKPVSEVIIRPLSLNMHAELREDGIHIPLTSAANFSVEINGSYAHSLLVFYSPSHPCELPTGAPNVMYFPRGVHTPGIIDIVQDDTLIYLEEGAWVNGKITVHDCKGFRLCGHGVLTEETYARSSVPHTNCLRAINCQNVLIRDVTLTDSVSWTCKISGCDDVHIDNVKIIGCRGNSDGFDICGSRNVLVENCFTRTWDDSLVVKAFDTGNLENVTFRKCILWNDFARPIEVGVELRADFVRNVLFDDIDIIHSPTGYPVMGIHHGDRALVSGITFRNIRIEDVPGAQMFDIRITNSVWNKDDRMGRIENIAFENIDLIGRPGITYLPEKSRLQGYSEENDIRGVSFKNIRYLGHAVTSLEEANLLIQDHVSDVSLEYDPALPPVGLIATEVLPEFPGCDADGFYRGTVQIKARNAGQHTAECRIWLTISPVNTAVFDSSARTLSLAPGEETSWTLPVTLPAGRYIFRIQSDSACVASSWQMLTLNLPLTEQVVEYPFVNYYGDRLASVRIAAKDDLLFLSSSAIARPDAKLIIYSAMPAEEFEGEVKFTVEETDFGEAPAVLMGRHGLELAPQLRCPAEITYVFKNEPRVREIRRTEVPVNPDCAACLTFEQLGLDAGAKHFWLEIEVRLPETAKYRYPYTLFHSVKPGEIAHMFAHIDVIN